MPINATQIIRKRSGTRLKKITAMITMSAMLGFVDRRYLISLADL